MKNPHDDEKLRRFVPHRCSTSSDARHPWVWPDEYHFPTVAEGAARVVKAGGNVSLGAHGQLQGLGAHWELWAMAGEGSHGRRVGPVAARGVEGRHEKRGGEARPAARPRHRRDGQARRI